MAGIDVTIQEAFKLAAEMRRAERARCLAAVDAAPDEMVPEEWRPEPGAIIRYVIQQTKAAIRARIEDGD